MHVAALIAPGVDRSLMERFAIDGVDLVESAYFDNCDAVIVFGGDGTLNRYLHKIIRRQLPMLCVPCGSGNDFATGLGLKDYASALAAWQYFCRSHDNMRQLDVVTVQSPCNEEKVFCNIAGVGFDSATNKIANRQPRWLRRHGGYIMAALKALLSFQPPTVRLAITNDSGKHVDIERQVTLIAFANGRSYGGGMRIAPAADLTDGLLDICIVAKTPGLRLLRLFPRVFSGSHIGLPEVEVVRAAIAEVRCKRALDLYGDGELLGQTPFTLRVRHKALCAIVPPPAEVH